MLDIFYSLKGLENDQTVVELVGPLYMMNHLSMEYYAPKMIYLKNNHLQLTMTPDARRVDAEILNVPRHYLSIKPLKDVVEFRMRIIEKSGSSNVYVRHWIVRSVTWLGRCDYFQLQSFQGVIPESSIRPMPLTASPETLEEIGLKCSFDRLVDDYEKIAIFSV